MQWAGYLISLMVSSGAVFAGAKNWSPTDLEVAVQGLNHVLEGGAWCGLKPEDARQLMLPLRPAWEKSVKNLAKRSSLGSEKRQALACKSTCTCGLWIVVFDHLPGLKKSELDSLRKHQRETSVADRQACLNKRTDLCKTLLPEMKSIADREFKSEGAF